MKLNFCFHFQSDHEYESAAEDDEEGGKGSDVEAQPGNGSDVDAETGNASDVEVEGGEEGLYPKDDDEKAATDKGEALRYGEVGVKNCAT